MKSGSIGIHQKLLSMVPNSSKRDQSPGEEIANSASHAFGLLMGLLGVPWLILHAAGMGEPSYLVGTCLFSATILLLYLASAIYHWLPKGKAKDLFQILDHSAIFLLIAGTYSPFTLGVLSGGWGWTLFGIVWGLAIVGVTLKSLGRASQPIVSTGLYLLMGWVVVIALDPLLTRVPTAGVVLLIAGGLSYTMGVIFFATDSRLKYGHLVWHAFVMGGTLFHYFAVLWYAA